MWIPAGDCEDSNFILSNRGSTGSDPGAKEWHDLTDPRTGLTTVLTADHSGAMTAAGSVLGGCCSDPGEK